ncbi:MAG: hypothetical protein WCY92_06520 [Novosphingobium sp.]
MQLTRYLPYRLRRRIETARHDRAISSVLATPPLIPRDDGVVLFSMIGTAVLLPYLVAVKSLWRHLQRGRVVLLDDGSLTSRDKELLNLHCGNPEIISLDSVVTDPFPRGSCWERFLTILDRRKDEYWIQLDSDTVTLADVPEVRAAVEGNRSFTMLSGDDGEIGALPLREIASALYPDGPADGHIQVRIESRMGQIGRDDWRYIRGCAGFAGFSAQGAGRPLAAEFLDAMKRLVGSDVVTWGTEQVASNFQVANDAEPVLLPARRYLNFWNEGWHGDTAFLHFVGSHRYDSGAYARVSREVIASL